MKIKVFYRQIKERKITKTSNNISLLDQKMSAIQNIWILKIGCKDMLTRIKIKICLIQVTMRYDLYCIRNLNIGQLCGTIFRRQL